MDDNGRTTAHLLTTSAGAGAVESAIAAKSNSVVQMSWEGDLTVAASPSPLSGAYNRVADQAVLVFETATGSTVKVVIPAPLASIFAADGDTVDAAQISSLIAAVIANAVTLSGDPVSSYLGGYRAFQ